jgi:uncharacterized iron-regulated membrane protein
MLMGRALFGIVLLLTGSYLYKRKKDSDDITTVSNATQQIHKQEQEVRIFFGWIFVGLSGALLLFAFTTGDTEPLIIFFGILSGLLGGGLVLPWKSM